MDALRAAPAGPLTVAAGQAGCAALDLAANVAVAAGLVRRAADQGAELVVLPELFLRGRGARRRATIGPDRALDNASYLVVANHTGPSGPFHGCGRSAVWGPDGGLVADAGLDDPGLAVARLDPEVLTRARLDPEVLTRARSGDLVLVDPSLHAPVHPRGAVSLD